MTLPTHLNHSFSGFEFPWPNHSSAGSPDIKLNVTRVEERMGDDKGITSTLGGSTQTARDGRVGADETVGKRCR